MSTERVFRKMLAPLGRRIRQIVARGIVRLIQDDKDMQLLQVTIQRGEVHDDVERFQEYGFTSHPHKGAEAVVGCVKGDRGHPVVIAVDDRRYRMKALKQGEVALYDDLGNYVHLKRDGSVEVNATDEVHAIAPNVLADCNDAVVNAANSVEVNTDKATVNADTSVDVVTAEATVQASAQVTLDSPLVQVTGLLQVLGGLSVSGGTGAAAQIDGDMEVTGDVGADGVSLRDHVHGGVSSGTETTGTPQ